MFPHCIQTSVQLKHIVGTQPFMHNPKGLKLGYFLNKFQISHLVQYLKRRVQRELWIQHRLKDFRLDCLFIESKLSTSTWTKRSSSNHITYRSAYHWSDFASCPTSDHSSSTGTHFWWFTEQYQQEDDEKEKFHYRRLELEIFHIIIW